MEHFIILLYCRLTRQLAFSNIGESGNAWQEVNSQTHGIQEQKSYHMASSRAMTYETGGLAGRDGGLMHYVSDRGYIYVINFILKLQKCNLNRVYRVSCRQHPVIAKELDIPNFFIEIIPWSYKYKMDGNEKSIQPHSMWKHIDTSLRKRLPVK